jgi:Zn-dependent protease with chaperone function
MIKFLLFGIVLAYTAMWSQTNLFLSSLGQKKSPVTTIQDDDLRQLIQNKTGTNIKSIKIAESDKPFGMMVGIPTKPQLILSRKLYDTFTPDEMEYVVLHEAGHYKLWHSVTELTAGIFLFVVGVLILRKVMPIPLSLPTALLLGVIFGILLIRIGRLHEYQADSYSLKHMPNPQGMIAATSKFREFYEASYPKNKVVQLLFYRGNPYDNRIKMAQAEILARKN